MANPQQVPAESISDDFLEQIFSMHASYGGGAGGRGPAGGEGAGGLASIALHRGSGDGEVLEMAVGGGAFGGGQFPLGLSLERGSYNGQQLHDDAEERDSVHFGGSFPPTFGRIQSNQIRPSSAQVFQGQVKQGGVASATQPPAPRPKVRARRGQATDPHSIAERLRRERIAERLRALQELVPNTNKADRAAMLDEVLDYVKFLRLQVKVLSMSRLGGAGAVSQLVADIPLSVEGQASDDSGNKQHVWEKWSTDGTEHHVAKLMEGDIGTAMQFLQSKALCMMPISLAMAIYDTHYQTEPQSVKPEPGTPS